MRPTKWLALLGTFVAAGVVLTVAYASEASDLRTRVRKLYDGLKTRARRDAGKTEHVEPSPPATEARTDQAMLVHAEHVLEHGAEGRARGADQSKKPHVRN